jgi:hypothetical protein
LVVRKVAAGAVRHQSSLPEEIISQFARPLYRIWRKRSFKEALSCYFEDQTLYINLPEGSIKYQSKGHQDQLRAAMRELQEKAIFSRDTLK